MSAPAKKRDGAEQPPERKAHAPRTAIAPTKQSSHCQLLDMMIST
ncbi:hypothetical protein [Brasilonema sennae]